MASFQEAYLADLLRQQAQASARTQWDTINNAQARTASAPKRPASRFDGPDVIDLVQGADGAWRVPEALEHRMRQP